MKSMLRNLRAPHKLVGAAALAIGLLATPIVSGHAAASFTVCDTDPAITLSNGTVVTVWAGMTTAISNIQQVTYVLHVPSWVTISNIAYDQYASLESVQLVQDQTSNSLEIDTTVQTSTPGIVVDALATVSNKLFPKLATGLSGQDMVITFWSS